MPLLLCFLGYECEAFNNPPDFFLDVINGDSTATISSQRLNGKPAHQQQVSNGGHAGYYF